ncbi:MAG: alpha/beta hydrolase [Deltaproteobacteria bacterium]|nr:alpha/beta hydrolase [Deltaproteobacteria bacterium]
MGATRETQVIARGAVELVVEAVGAGPLVVLAHGFPDCPATFRYQVPALVEAGFRVATLAMRGYAPSSAARDGRYDAAALGDDLLAVGEALSPEARFSLVGHDWGAIASYAAAARAPSRLARLITLAVPHLRVALPRFFAPAQLRRSFYMLEFQPRSADARVRANGFARIEALWRRWSPGYSPSPEELEAVRAALEPHVEGPLGYYRALLRPTREVLGLLLARTRVPAMYLHGVDDGCVDLGLARGCEAAYERGCEVVRVRGAGHFLHLERPTEVNGALVRFLGVGRDGG